MSRLIIPTMFTAVDRLSVPVLRMQTAVGQLAAFSTRAERSFNNFIPNIDAAVKNRISFMVSMAKAMAVVGVAMLTVNSLVEYEKELANLKALTGATGKEFTQFKKTIQQVSTDSRTSAVEVAQSFTTVANAMPELLGSAEGLGKVTSASILLAKASRMELAPAADALTTILKQVGMGASDATRLVDMMAAGSKYGSAEIEDLSQTMREFGASARLAGVSAQESIALTELVSNFRKGTQAGIELRNVMLYLDTLKVQDPKALADMHRLGVNMDVVANKALPLTVRLAELKKIVGDDAALFHVFGKENLAMAQTVLENSDRLGTLIQQVGESGNAMRMAEENTRTLWWALKELKAAWVNIVTASSGANWAMTTLGNSVRFVGEHLGAIVNLALPVVGFLTAWRVGILAIATAQKVLIATTVAYNAVVGFMAGIMGTMPAIVVSSTVAFRSYTIATYIAAAASRVFGQGVAGVANLMMGLPLILGAAAIAFAMIHSRMTDTYEASEQMRKSLDKTQDGFKQIRKPISDAQIALNTYNAEMDKYNEKVEYARHLDYERNRGGFHAMTFRLLHPIMDIENTLWQQQIRDSMAGANAPAPMDFFKGITPGQYEVQTPESQADTNVHVYVNVDKEGNVQVNGKNATGAVPVQIKRTGYQ